MPLLRRLLSTKPDPEKREYSEAVIDALRGGSATATGVSVTPESALRASTVYACVRVLAETVAALPLLTYKRQARGKERATNFYLYDKLHTTPNPEMSSFTYRETMTGHVALWGNAYSEIETDGAGRMVNLWPMRPDQTYSARSKMTNEPGYVTYVPGAGQMWLPADRVFHLKGLSLDGITGLSPIGLARQAIGLAIATEEFGARFFGNGAQPGIVITHPGQLGDEAYKHLKTSWNEAHQGLDNSHRAAILEEGMGVEKIGIPPEDAQFLETRKFQVVDIARIYRIPPHLVGSMDAATFGNIEQQSLEFVTYTMMPWLTRWEQEIARSIFLPAERANYFAEFMVDGLLRGDIASRYAAYATGRQWGWFSVNDIRALENMNPIDGGDAYLEPMNMVEVGAQKPAGGQQP